MDMDRNEQYSRSEWLFGQGTTDRLRRCHVAVFGLGGVGSYTVEALARMGVGHLTLIDGDKYSLSNLNRQLYATQNTLGMPKVQAAKDRIADIDPAIAVDTVEAFILPDSIAALPLSSFDYIADAIDTVSAKIALAEAADRLGIPMISAMGAGNKTDPTAFRVADIYKTSVCPLARAVRNECKKRGIRRLKAVYSEELPCKTQAIDHVSGKPLPASCSFVPSVVGLIMAGQIIRDLLASH